MACFLHNYEAIEIILGHLDEQDLHKEGDISKVESWNKDKLVPLYCLSLESFVQRGLGLPGAFLRAVYHGSNWTVCG